MQLQKLDRRQFTKYVAALSGSVAIAGCTGRDGNGETTGTASPTQMSKWVHEQEQLSNPSKIKWLNLGSMDGDPATATHAEQWSQKSGVSAEPQVIPTSEGLNKSRSLLQSQSAAPDVYQLLDTWFWDLATNGFWEDVSNFVDTFDGWVPGAKKACTLPLEGVPEFQDYPYREGIYATPWFAEGWTTYANMDVLEEAGMSRDFTAKSYTEFREALEMTLDVVDTPLIFPFSSRDEGLQIFQDLVLRAGGHFYDGTDPDFMNDGFIEALDFLLNLVFDGYAPRAVTSLTEGQTTTQFFDGKAAFQFNALGNLFLPGKELPVDRPAEEVARIQLYPNPDDKGYEETPTGQLTVVTASLSVYSKRKEPAAKFMNFMSTKEQQAEELIQEGNLPLRADVFEMSKVQDEMPYVDTMQSQLAGYDKLIYPNASQVTDLIYQEITGALANKRGANETAQRIQNKAENI